MAKIRFGEKPKMRLNIRFKIGNMTFFGMISHTQTLKGVTNKIGKDQYFIFWDMENCTLEQAENTLYNVQKQYCLSDIFIVSDYPKSFRAYCFSIVTFQRFLAIICSTEHMDYNFIHWSVVRGKATLRTSNKLGRSPQKVVSVLHNYYNEIIVSIPERLKRVIYDTGYDKRGKTLNIENGEIRIGQIS